MHLLLREAMTKLQWYESQTSKSPKQDREFVKLDERSVGVEREQAERRSRCRWAESQAQN